jgi:hypothetical protein
MSQKETDKRESAKFCEFEKRDIGLGTKGRAGSNRQRCEG